jgi:hypothetical protein
MEVRWKASVTQESDAIAKAELLLKDMSIVIPLNGDLRKNHGSKARLTIPRLFTSCVGNEEQLSRIILSLGTHIHSYVRFWQRVLHIFAIR